MRESRVPSILQIPELKSRILFTLGLLAVFRIGAHIPTPGIDTVALSAFFAELTRSGGTIMQFFDLFTGGALSQLTIFALGIMPYISASIILELLTVVVPHLERLKKEGESGRKKISQYTRYGTVLLSTIQGFGIAVGIEQMTSPTGAAIVPEPGWSFRLMTVLTLVAGTSFIMWLGEQITERGIGNGISLVIFAGIVVGLPGAIMNTFRLLSSGEIQPFVMIIITVLMIAVVALVVWFEAGQRRIRIQYPKRMVGRKMAGGQDSHLPLKVNTSGVIPPIFASSMILFPATIAQFSNVGWLKELSAMLTPPSPFYVLLTIILIFFFAYFYTAIIFNPMDVAENLRKYGGFVPGRRPGRPTADFIDRTLSRLTFLGAIYLSAIVILPTYLVQWFNVPFYFGGTALLIVVGVAVDTQRQIESHLVMRNYEGFLKRGRIRGR
ncbi:MAG: preprotein translocase subunit SecY [Nitrospinota bacterium]|nr:preprotein translocase subunit SecY [Nitrospinota bacterium]